MTVTHLTDGRSILEIGEHVVHFSRTEGGMVGQAYAGIALEHTALARVTELQDQLLEEVAKRRALERKVEALKVQRKADPRQGDLLMQDQLLV